MLVNCIRTKRSGLAATLFLGTMLLLGLQACKHESVDPGFGPDGQPRVLAVHIPDIPDQNIQIDQNQKQIVITLPTSFSAQSINPVLTLTPNTSAGQSYGFDVVDANASRQTVSLTTTDNKTNTYTTVLKPAADLAFSTVTGPLSYSLTNQAQYICLPVYNFPDGQPLSSVTVSLTHKASGERIVTSGGVIGRQSICDQKTRTDGAVVVSVALSGADTYYRPGDYTLVLSKANGRTATLSQPIQLAAGLSTVGFSVDQTLKLNSGDYLLYGTNFYKNDKMSVQIQGRNQPPITLDALGFVDDRPGIRLPTNLNLKPGYYYAQLLVNGVPTASSGRIAISDQAKPLVLEALSLPGQPTYKNLLGPSYSFDTPLVLTRGVGYNISTNYVLFTQNDPKAVKQVRLISLANPSSVFTIPFSKDEYGSSDQIVLPGTLPAGSYQLTTQVIRSDGTEFSSFPLERDIVIQ